MIRRTRRPGLSLTEVLVALFVMALGLISLLTLFPLGAIRMAAAMRDDRCAQTAQQADAFIRAYWQRAVVEAAAATDPIALAMDDPNLQSQAPYTGSVPNVPRDLLVNTYRTGQRLPTSFTLNATNFAASASGTSVGLAPPFNHASVVGLTAPVADTVYYRRSDDLPGTRNQPSFPVMFDPLGFRANSLNLQIWVSDEQNSATSLLLPRRTWTPTPTAAATVIEACSLMDDLAFDGSGAGGDGTTVDRGAKYNWSAVVQRPNNSRRNVANLTILVFDNRPPLLPVPQSEVTVTQTVTAGTASITLTMPAPTDTNAPPLVRKGGWFMDGSITHPLTTAGALRNAHFYRIVGVNPDPVTPNQFHLDIEPPLRTSSAVDAMGNIIPSTFYFFSGLAEVFERPPLKPLD